MLMLATQVPLSSAEERVEKDKDGTIRFTNIPQDNTKKSSKTPVKLTKKILISTTQRDMYRTCIDSAAKKYDLDPDLIQAIIRVESNFKKKAKSHKGAMGLMQLMPSTAKDMGVKDAYDPEQNIHGGSRYLRELMNSFKDLRLALAAYNAGPGAVEKHKGIPPYRETKTYVSLVMQLYKGPYAFSEDYFVRTNDDGDITFTNLDD